MEVKVKMPSNIALIKYMGKSGGGKNRPANSSLSWTLPHLTTEVQLSESGSDNWQALPSDFSIELSEKGQSRYLDHFDFLRTELGGQGTFQVASASNFPADCGIASSASSFAALTQAACELFAPDTALEKRAWLSSQGSGSSCRSFHPDWVLWAGDTVRAIESPYKDLLHMVVVVEGGKKTVSSSEAHQRVQMSLLFNDRVLRAEVRLRAFMEAMSEKDWPTMFQIAWAEFWDMHALFETSNPPFSYFQPQSIAVLEDLRQLWMEEKDGPLVTMDAGPNVHLLWRPDQLARAKKYFADQLKGKATVLTNIEGIEFAKL